MSAISTLLEKRGLVGLYRDLDDFGLLADALIKLHGSLDVVYQGMTPLQLACLDGDVDNVRMLLGRGASTDFFPLDDPEKPDKSILDMSPLAVAAQMNHPQVALVLLEAGADVRGESGATAMSAALYQPDPRVDSSEVVALLRKWGAGSNLEADRVELTCTGDRRAARRRSASATPRG